MENNLKYYIIHKPYGVICQFTKEGNHPTLAELDFNFPKDVYPVGRLDTDSEGLLILSNDKQLNNLLLNPDMKHTRCYYAQVEGIVSEEKLNELQRGVTVSINGKPYKTKPCKAEVIPPPPLPNRNPPIRYRKNIPTSWLKITLLEGKNRQVRKITAQIGYPTLRLIRHSIENITLEKVPQSGDIMELNKKDIYSLLNIRKIS